MDLFTVTPTYSINFFFLLLQLHAVLVERRRVFTEGYSYDFTTPEVESATWNLGILMPLGR